MRTSSVRQIGRYALWDLTLPCLWGTPAQAQNGQWVVAYSVAGNGQVVTPLQTVNAAGGGLAILEFPADAPMVQLRQELGFAFAVDVGDGKPARSI